MVAIYMYSQIQAISGRLEYARSIGWSSDAISIKEDGI